MLHLVSDSTGETVAAAVTAALAQFAEAAPRRRLHVFVRNAAALDDAMADVAARPGAVFYTLVEPDLRDALRARCGEIGVPAIDVLEPIVAALSREFGPPVTAEPGRQHGVEAGYFERVSAIDFAIASDDGARAERYRRADVILAGVSRTSKTPTCIYLACRGVKAANAPIIPNQPEPEGLRAAVEAGVPVVGLTISPNRLVQIRAHRLEALGQEQDLAYADLASIRREVAEARVLLESLGAPILDVTRRSIEETAAAIMAIMRGAEGGA